MALDFSFRSLSILLLSFCLTLRHATFSVAQQLGFNTIPVTWQAVPFNGRSIPLAVKGPCNSAWSSQSSHTSPINQNWARTWDTFHDVRGWYASVRVDGVPYILLGDLVVPQIAVANQTVVVITPTRTSYLLEAGPVIVNMTFLSPIEPLDPVKTSSPFSYLYFTFTSNDTSVSHNVQLYSDISGGTFRALSRRSLKRIKLPLVQSQLSDHTYAYFFLPSPAHDDSTEWLSSNNAFNMTWTGGDDGTLTMLQATLLDPQPFQVLEGSCQDGTIYYAVQSSNETSWQIDFSNSMRAAFASATPGSGLNNSENVFGSREISDGFITFAISVDAGDVTTTTDPIIYSVGLVRDPVIQYTDPKGQLQDLSPLYSSAYKNVSELLQAVFNNFTDSVATAQEIDSKITADGNTISSEYADLLAISTRQAFGAADLTAGISELPGTRSFSWDIGVVGSGGVNAVDVLYAAMPAYIYLWPEYLGYLLTPLLEYQSSPQYTNPYAAQDVGAFYPNATGDNLQHNAQVEQTANMLIMALAHAQASGDGSLLAQYYDLLVGWANFLVSNALTPGSAETTSASDDIFGANQTNLALKGIIGIGAMAKISEYGGQTSDQAHYQNVAEQYASQWSDLAVSSGFISVTYGSEKSGIIYNLYADKLLKTNLVNSSIFDLQSSFYASQIPQYSFGLPVSFDNLGLARTDWIMFAAAVASDTGVRNSLINGIRAYASSSEPGTGDWPFAVLYDPSSAVEFSESSAVNTGGMNSFAQGAMFAPLALNVPVKNLTFTPILTSSKARPSKKKTGAIAGGVIGGLAGLSSVTAVVLIWLRRRRLANDQSGPESQIEPWSPASKEPSVPSHFERRRVIALREKGETPPDPIDVKRRQPSPSGRTQSESEYTYTSDYTSETGSSRTETTLLGPQSRRQTRGNDRTQVRRTRRRPGEDPLPLAPDRLMSVEVQALRREVERLREVQEQNNRTGRNRSRMPPPSYRDEPLEALIQRALSPQPRSLAGTATVVPPERVSGTS